MQILSGFETGFFVRVQIQLFFWVGDLLDVRVRMLSELCLVESAALYSTRLLAGWEPQPATKIGSAHHHTRVGA